MAEERTTSHAKTVQLDSYDENSLDRQEPLTDRFNNAEDDNSQELDTRSNGDEKSMIEKEAPEHNNRPPPEIADAQDRETFNERLKDEFDREAMKLEYALEAAAAIENDNSENNDQGRSYDDGYDLGR